MAAAAAAKEDKVASGFASSKASGTELAFGGFVEEAASLFAEDAFVDDDLVCSGALSGEDEAVDFVAFFEDGSFFKFVLFEADLAAGFFFDEEEAFDFDFSDN
mmetsp:Transcript_1679/g.3958  ORF Transcript_1679/g.3958 Transcript_1679/m.3958 type:complete len:103 (+) Transcript_1679:1425-1733(+)